MTYCHRQKSPLYLVVLVPGTVLVAIACIGRGIRPDTLTLGGCGLLMILLAFCFHYLEVRDEGDFLALRYGPLPLFRRRIQFSKITSAESSRSSILDGWGIHYIPFRGMIYNLWGFDCVKLKLGNRIIRVGSDDVEGLIRFLKERLNCGSSSAPS